MQRRHPQFKEVVDKNWQVDFCGSPFIIYQAKIKKVKTALAKWSKETFGDLFKKIATLEDVIKANEAQFEIFPSKQNRAKLSLAEEKVKRFRNIKEEYWKQKAGIRLFKDGDNNSKFFHSYVRGRRKELHIVEI